MGYVEHQKFEGEERKKNYTGDDQGRNGERYVQNQNKTEKLGRRGNKRINNEENGYHINNNNNHFKCIDVWT